MNIKTDMERSYHIENNGGQVVIANDQSTVTASQNNVVNDNRFVELRDSVINAAKEAGATESQLTEIKDILSEIEKQIKEAKPKRSLLDAFFAGLHKIANGLKDSALVVDKIGVLATFVWERLKDLIH
jgi:archaellum component FlaC